MASIKFDLDLEKRLDNLSRKTNRAKSYYIKTALKKYLDENEERFLELARLEEEGSNSTSQKQAERK